MSNLIKNTTIYAIGDIVPRLLGFISFPILTNYLSPAEYGIVNYINVPRLVPLIWSFSRSGRLASSRCWSQADGPCGDYVYR